ncbi:MAG: aldehyde dehydrogenase family protein [Solirubrobacterales bacterium]|nr:aldehyde dehydrogenase family protein [Solirubrobacterales bacterium]
MATETVAESESATTPALESFNPATGELVGTVETITPDQVQGVVDEVARIQPAWAELSPSDRANYLKRAATVLLDRLDEIAALLSQEQGKPISECYTMELIPSIDALRWCAKEGPGILKAEKISYPQPFFKTKRSKFKFQPIGVVGVIAPWNYPWTIPMQEIAIALMCGNGVVLKPASLTPLLGEAIQSVFEDAGLPKGLVRNVHGGGRIGDALTKSTAGKIFFTGSVPVGYKVGEECAKLMKGCVLELGGKDPMIVLEDANIDFAISGAVWGGFANAGQTCAGIERAYVRREVSDKFIEGVVAGASALKVGDPSEVDTEIGPMVSKDQYDLVRELVDDAVASGATLRCGGPVDVEGFPEGNFIAPVVLTDVTHDMRIMNEEIFGPVLPIMTVDSDQEALDLANDSEFGLGSSVWTKDRQRGERIADKIDAGMVWINDHMFTHGACQCTWGGVKDSGLGHSHSKFGFYECVEIKLVTYEPGLTRNFWWHPYDETLAKAMKSSANLLYGKGGQRIEALKSGAGPLLQVGKRITKRGS